MAESTHRAWVGKAARTAHYVWHGLIALVALILAIALTTAAQEALLHRILVSSGATDIQVDGLRVSPRGVRAAHLHLVQNGLTYDLRDLAVAVDPVRLWSREAHIHSATAKSVDIEIASQPTARVSASSATASAAPRAPAGSSSFQGELPPLALPWRVWLDALDFSGTLTLRAQGKTTGVCVWQLHGAGLAPGHTGTFSYTVAPTGALFDVASGGTNTGTVTLTEGPVGHLTSIGLAGQAHLGSDALAAWEGKTDASGSEIHLTAERIPLAWANPYLAPHGITFSAGLASGAWKLRFAKNLIRAESDHPLAITGWSVQTRNAAVPPLPPLDAQLSFSGSVAEPGNRIHLEQLDLAGNASQAASGAAGASGLSVRLLHPIDVDPAALTQAPKTAFAALGAADLLRIAIRNLPLDGISRWTPGREIHGSLASADATVKPVLDLGLGLTLAATSPWRFTGLRYHVGNRDLFQGEFSASPSVMYTPTEQWARLQNIRAADDNGNTLVGSAGLAWKTKDDRIGGGIRLELDLPHFPGVARKVGAYQVALAAAAHLDPDGKGSLAKLTVSVKGRQDEELASVIAEAPVMVEKTPAGEWLLSSALPLRMKTARVPLAGMSGLLANQGFTADGIIPATEFELWLAQGRVRIEPKTPLAIGRFHLERDGKVLVEHGMLRVTPAVDVTARYHLLPAFGVTMKADTSLTHGVLAIDGARAGLFDLKLSAAGDERTVKLTDVSGGLWLDLGALGKLGLLSHARLPAKGSVALSFGKAPKDPKVVEFDGSVDDVVGRDGALAPRLRFNGRAGGNMTDKIGGFGVNLTLEPLKQGARPSDAHFGFKLDYANLAVPAVNSKLTGNYVNVDDLRVFAAAFKPAALPSTSPVVQDMQTDAKIMGGGGSASPATSVPAPSVAVQAVQTDAKNGGAGSSAALPASTPGPWVAGNGAHADATSVGGGGSASPPPIAAQSGATQTPSSKNSLTTAAGDVAAENGDVPSPPPWGIVRGKFALAIKQVDFAPYTLSNLGGTLEADDRHLSLRELSGDILGGTYSADLTAAYDPRDRISPDALSLHFTLSQLDAAKAVALRYPNPPAGIDGRINLDVTLQGRSRRWDDLIDSASGTFAVSADGGRMRLVLPKQDTISNALLIGGTLTFSKEMRALGRFVKALQSIPIDTLRASGTLTRPGELQLAQLQIRSPELRLEAVGNVSNAKTRDLLGEPLRVNATLSVKGDLGVICDGMHLLNPAPPPPSADGFRSLQRPFAIGGEVGEPDFHGLYDLLAQAVQGSHGSWGLLMRKVQAKIPK